MSACALTVVLLLVSCSPTAFDQFRHELSGRSFQITELTREGNALPLAGQPHITFSSGQFTADTGCNTVTGGYARTARGYKLRRVSSTLRGCAAELAAQDDIIREVLTSGTRITVSESSIVIRNGDRSIVGQRSASG
ncbi:META domain-containing protein [Kocuria sp. CPCC 205258]|uniref:META domain-containing protein n=1 Tax=Kocuria sp. CPCC 205258 TaxID=3073552 RepID=UPI0034D48EC6